MSTVTLPEFGKNDWTDYIDYWRDDDAEWLQSRTIMRFAATPTAGEVPVPERGQVVYNNTLDMLQLRSNTNIWRNYQPLPYNMLASQDNANGVLLKHKDIGSGVLFTSGTYTPAGQASSLLVGVPLYSAGNAVILDSGGITLKTGAATAKLTTDATSLSSDIPVSVPNLTVRAGGVLTTPTANISGTTTLGTLSVTGNASINGTVSAAAGSAIAGVAFTANSIRADGGVTTLGGLHYGAASAARVGTGTVAAPGASYAEVTAAAINLHATGDIFLDGQPYVDATTTVKAVQYRKTGITTVNIAPSFYAAADPGAANFPDGTIWIS